MKAFREYLAESRIPKELEGLAAEARKAGSFEKFKKDFLIQTKHGIYWHLTDNPKFRIDPRKGPTDRSSLASGKMTPGAIMFTTDLENWKEYYPDRQYAALLDLSNVPRDKYQQTSRGFGNEFFVTDASKVKVVKVIPLRQALAYDRRVQKMLPDSKEALKDFYEKAK